MPHFLDLPRELRDMIYIVVITYEAPKPRLEGIQPFFEYWSVTGPDSNRRGEYGCKYSYAGRPSTCASFLVCNRQIYEEMGQAIERVDRKGLLAAKMDCIAENESFHYFTWLSMPMVKTSRNTAEGKSRMMPWWASRMVGRYLATPQQALNSGSLAYRGFTTLIHRLWVDVRLVGDRSAKWLHNDGPPDRTSWAICAALKRIFDNGPDFASSRDSATEISIDELVLNVVTPPSPSQGANGYLAADFPTDGAGSGLVHPQTVARELVDVWNKIWSGDEFKGMFYHVLLERIQKVRVCVDGVTWRARELRSELERGQAERRRIAARVGW